MTIKRKICLLVVPNIHQKLLETLLIIILKKLGWPRFNFQMYFHDHWVRRMKIGGSKSFSPEVIHLTWTFEYILLSKTNYVMLFNPSGWGYMQSYGESKMEMNIWWIGPVNTHSALVVSLRSFQCLIVSEYILLLHELQIFIFNSIIYSFYN